MRSNTFPSKYVWKRTVKTTVRNHEIVARDLRMSEDADFSRFILLYAGNYQTPYHYAKSTKELKAAKNLVKLWTRPPNKDSYLCMECRVLANDIPFHMVTTCISTLQIRQEFIKLMTDTYGHDVGNELSLNITKTCLNNFDPLKPHFYIVKLGFTGVHISFHISPQNIHCEYSLEPPRRGGSNEYPQSMF